MDWIEIAQRFGFPVCMVLVLCFAILWSCRWAASNVATPLVQGHLSFMRQLQSYLLEQNTLKKSHLQLTEQIRDEIQSQGEKLQEIHTAVHSSGSCRYPASGPKKHPPS